MDNFQVEELRTFEAVRFEDVMKDLNFLGIPKLEYVHHLKEILMDEHLLDEDLTHVFLVREVVQRYINEKKGPTP